MNFWFFYNGFSTTISLQLDTFYNNGCSSAGALYHSNGYWLVM